MRNEQLIMGAGVAVLCLFGLYHSRWFLARTRKGQRLVGWFGETRALWVLRGLLTAGTVFGVLLAANVIRPLRW
jgi:hypothetical protein